LALRVTQLSLVNERLASATASLLQTERALGELQNREVSVRDTVGRLEKELQSIRISCGANTYETCPDEAAKRDYNRILFETNEALREARRARQALLDERKKLRNQRSSLSSEVLKLRLEAMTMRQALPGERVSLRAALENHQIRTQRLQAAERILGPLPKANQQDLLILSRALDELAR
jgi:chromosome segregation ATPase